jgi:hypothetical protein
MKNYVIENSKGKTIVVTLSRCHPNIINGVKTGRDHYIPSSTLPAPIDHGDAIIPLYQIDYCYYNRKWKQDEAYISKSFYLALQDYQSQLNQLDQKRLVA